MTEPYFKPSSIFTHQIGVATFLALAMPLSGLGIAAYIGLDVSFGHGAAFVAIALAALLICFFKGRNPHIKRVADLFWNVWSCFGIVVLFSFLAEVGQPISDLKTVLSRLPDLALTAVFLPVYGAACLKAFMSLFDVFSPPAA